MTSLIGDGWTLWKTTATSYERGSVDFSDFNHPFSRCTFVHLRPEVWRLVVYIQLECTCVFNDQAIHIIQFIINLCFLSQNSIVKFNSSASASELLPICVRRKGLSGTSEQRRCNPYQFTIERVSLLPSSSIGGRNPPAGLIEAARISIHSHGVGGSPWGLMNPVSGA